MPSLACSAQNCVYNDAMYCCKGDIMVGGEDAEHSRETCCESFLERKTETMKDSVGTPSQNIWVDCSACQCIYNEDRKCTADKIDITGAAAVKSRETECATFECECE